MIRIGCHPLRSAWSKVAPLVPPIASYRYYSRDISGRVSTNLCRRVNLPVPWHTNIYITTRSRARSATKLVNRWYSKRMAGRKEATSVAGFTPDLSSDMSLDELPQDKAASEMYQRLSQLEHVLKRPDTYIGSVEFHESKQWVADQEGHMQFKTVSIVPGLFKIFDEILVNAADNKVRDPAMKSIKVSVNPDIDEITVVNDGKGIPIEIHDKEGIYIPELIFGNLLTSSNYDDDEKKVTGGRNGFGAKLCNIFSTRFILETADKKQVYHQEWSNNMTKVEKPVITKNKTGKSYTSITFYPDLPKFSMEKLDDDIMSVLRRRVWDLAGTSKGVNVSWNDVVLPVKDFKSYVDLFVKALNSQSEGETRSETILYVKPNDRWEVAFALSDGQFNQVSFVNSIATTSGGTHVNYIVDQVINYVLTSMNTKKKGSSAKLQRAEVKNNLFVFINSKINNPSFTSQTKEQLTSKVTAFGSKAEISDKFLKDVLNKTGLFDRLQAISERNGDKQLSKQDGGKKKRLTGIAALNDANKAGTRESHKCTLILTEGASANTLAVAGINHIGRDYYGCFPLRGKMLNVRDASQDQILKNAEIQALKQIVGLQHKKRYTSVDGLRYGHIMIMTDQDHDGSHIKGLIINFLESSFPGLLDVPGFLLEFITPIVKVSIMNGTRVKKVLPFFNIPEYDEWREREGHLHKWTHKYYKGLGTSTPADFKEYFSMLDVHEKTFLNLQDGDKERIELAFAKGKADDRKQWLQDYKPGTFLDPAMSTIPISDFIDKELILFSMADNTRSIPSVIDGLKPAQRKVVWASFLRKLYREIRVAQLAGWVSEKAAYHHGEVSLQGTIVNLAQDFVGAYNFYYLLPKGSFGSRGSGGKDAAAARYIYTLLNPLTKVVFNPLDDPVLDYQEDEGNQVEPVNYVPILPTLLVNGSEGIGTAWSSNIPCFNPTDIVANLRRMMKGEPLVPMVPWFRGWTGTIDKIPGSEHQYRVVGRIEEIDETTLAITELPAKMWTQTMKEFLLRSIIGASRESKEKDKKSAAAEFIQDFTEEHGSGVRFVVKLSKEEMAKAKQVGLYTKFKLITPLSTSNMVAFDAQGRLRKYRTPEDIIKDFFYIRLQFYQKRKDHMSAQLRNDLEKISAQARFIKLIIDKKLIISNRARADVIRELHSLKFPRFGKSGVPIWDAEDDLGDATSESSDEDELIDQDIVSATETAMTLEDTGNVVKEDAGSFDYLLSMSIMSLTRERYEKLLQQRDRTEEELSELLGKKVEDLWSTDLDTFMVGWDAFLIQDSAQREDSAEGAKAKPKTQSRKRARKIEDDDDDDDDDDFGVEKKKPSKKKAKTPATKALPQGVIVAPPPVEEALQKAKVKKEGVSRQSTPSVAKSEGSSATSVSPEPENSAATAAQQGKLLATKAKPKAKPKSKTRAVSDSEDSDIDMADSESDHDVAPVKREVRPRRAAAVPAPVVQLGTSDVESEEDDENPTFILSD